MRGKGTTISPKSVSGMQAKKHGQTYYPPDGTGRDTYVIKNHGGTCNENFMHGLIKMEDNQYLRHGSKYDVATPRANQMVID